MSRRIQAEDNGDDMLLDGSLDSALQDAVSAARSMASVSTGGTVTPRKKRASRADVESLDEAEAETKPRKRATAAEHLSTLETTEAKPGKLIVIPDLDIRTIQVIIAGDSSLIVHRFSEKAQKMMLDKQMGTPSEGRRFKDPDQDFRDSLYIIEDADPEVPAKRRKKGFERYGFPAIAFKNAAVTACTSLNKAVTKTAARQVFHMVGDLVEIHGKPTRRQDTVRIGGGVADIRHRPEFKNWWCRLTIVYNARAIRAEQVVNLLNLAGFAVGVGEWRPEKNGAFGRFHVHGGEKPPGE